ncbi:domain AAA [Cryptosporidium sp. chipmunk genotype I]|uniref:domain AAA n=1 Tax=Cryptosporidium sp. chipmunk genotype I TaxID=1280935 RepID=UPI00351AABDF|nr:domain AAA [Cryptosporidium sp. chipmunk genotype I]
MHCFKPQLSVHFRQLPYDISSTDLYDIFGRHGTIRQIRRGVGENTKGTAFVVYDEIEDAKNALRQLSGFHVSGRSLGNLIRYNFKISRNKHDGLHLGQISFFLSKWRLKLNESFTGGPLIDDFFEKIGLIFYLFSLRRCESTFCTSNSNGMNIDPFIAKLPTVLLLTGNSGSGKRYFMRELLSSFSKTCHFTNSNLCDPVTFDVSIDKYIVDIRAKDRFNKSICDLENKLRLISKIGIRLRSSLCNGFYFPSAVLVCFGSVNSSNCLRRLSSHYYDDTSNQIVVILNLISKFIRIWDDEGIPIVSFFISDLDSDKDDKPDKILNSEITDIKYIFKYGCGGFFEIDFSNFLFQVNKISLLRFLIYRRYGINVSALDYLMKKISGIHSETIMSLSNEELKFIVNEIDLVRIKDILNYDEQYVVPYTTSCGNFIAIVLNDVKPDFFSVFLYYFNSVIGKLDTSIGSTKYIVRSPSCFKGISSYKNGLMEIIGCREAISKVKNLLFPCILHSPKQSNFRLPIVFNEASGIIVFGDKGCGKSFLVKSISNSLNCSVKFIHAADIFNANIGFLERYLRDIIDTCTKRRRYILVLEDIDRYLLKNNALFPFMFLFDIISRSNKWNHTEIMIFGTSTKRHAVCANTCQVGCGEWNLREIINILNLNLRPLLTRFSKRVSIKVCSNRIDALIEDVASFIKPRFTPSVAMGIVNDLGFFILKLLIEYSNENVPLDPESFFVDIIYRKTLNIAVRNCEL